MRTFSKSSKLDNVCYDIRGPVMDEANEMIAKGEKIFKLNIGNPAPFAFNAPDEIIQAMTDNLRNAQGYSDSKGITEARQAIYDYAHFKGIPVESLNDIYTGNGVSELITMVMQGLLNNGDEVLVPALTIRCGQLPLLLQAVLPFTISVMKAPNGILTLRTWKRR